MELQQRYDKVRVDTDGRVVESLCSCRINEPPYEVSMSFPMSVRGSEESL